MYPYTIENHCDSTIRLGIVENTFQTTEFIIISQYIEHSKSFHSLISQYTHTLGIQSYTNPHA